MPKSAIDRINNYTNNLSPDAVKERLIQKKPGMVAKETVIFTNQVDLDKRAKAVLASEGAVTAIQVANYLAFVRHVNHLVGVHEGGAQLNGEVAVSVAGWKARGLTEAVLIRLRNELFSIPAPAAP